MPASPSPSSPSKGEPNLDPITGAPGAHPVGAGVGAAAGAAAGATVCALGGPVGVAAGAVVGGVVGGLAGKGVAEAIDPTAEEAYWRERHGAQPYATSERPYEVYAAAYAVGYLGFREGQTFDVREAELQKDYERRLQEAGAGYAQDMQRTATPESTPGTMEYHMTTRPVRGDSTAPANGDSPESTPGTMQHNMSTNPLRWDAARAAARAAYERVASGEGRRMQSMSD